MVLVYAIGMAILVMLVSLAMLAILATLKANVKGARIAKHAKIQGAPVGTLDMECGRQVTGAAMPPAFCAISMASLAMLASLAILAIRQPSLLERCQGCQECQHYQGCQLYGRRPLPPRAVGGQALPACRARPAPATPSDASRHRLPRCRAARTAAPAPRGKGWRRAKSGAR